MEGQRQYVGIDLHRRRSVIVRRSHEGETLELTRIDNSDLLALERAVMAAGDHPVVVVESCYGWYWLVDYLDELGCEVHLAHPLGNNWGNRRVKNDDRDATDLADLLRMGRLAEGWIAPRDLREKRELVRYRQKLVRTRTSMKNQVHAVLAKEGASVTVTDLFGAGGQVMLDQLHMGEAYESHVESLRRLLTGVNREIGRLASEIETQMAHVPSYKAIQQIPGVGPVLAAVLVSEIGDVTRFPSAKHLCSWAGLTPRHRESDTTVRRGHITKQGSALVRWAAVEAAARHFGRGPMATRRACIAERRGKRIAQVAAARQLLTLVYYGLRDGEIRCLAEGG
jgi:transposase